MRGFILVGLVLLVAGCMESPLKPTEGYDQCQRREMFEACLSKLPTGPTSVHNSNDWSEVVDSCQSAASQSSWRPLTQIKPECRSQ